MVEAPPLRSQRLLNSPLLLAAAVLLTAVALPLPQHGAIAGLPSICGFYHLTGIPCPACGLTRAFVCCAHGHFREAFLFHPLGPPLFLMTVLIVLATPWQDSLRPGRRQRSLLLVGLLALLAIAWFVRLAGFFPLPP